MDLPNADGARRPAQIPPCGAAFLCRSVGPQHAQHRRIAGKGWRLFRDRPELGRTQCTAPDNAARDLVGRLASRYYCVRTCGSSGCDGGPAPSLTESEIRNTRFGYTEDVSLLVTVMGILLNLRLKLCPLRAKHGNHT